MWALLLVIICNFSIFAILRTFTSDESLLKIETYSQHLYHLVRGEKSPEDKIVIIDIDETSIEHIGKWPWSNQKTEELLTLIIGMNPRIIGLPIIFVDMIDDKRSKEEIIEPFSKIEVVFGYSSIVGIPSVCDFKEVTNISCGYLDFVRDTVGNMLGTRTNSNINTSSFSHVLASKYSGDSIKSGDFIDDVLIGVKYYKGDAAFTVQSAWDIFNNKNNINMVLRRSL